MILPPADLENFVSFCIAARARGQEPDVAAWIKNWVPGPPGPPPPPSRTLPPILITLKKESR